MKLFLLSFLALASESGATTLTPIITAMGDLVDVVGEVWDVMVSNPLFLTFLGASLFSVGIWIFKKVKRAAKG